MKIPSHRVINLLCAASLAVTALAAYAMNGDWATGLLFFGALAVLIVASEVLRRRSVSGVGILMGDGDEREQTLYRRAQTRSVELFAWVLGGWAVVSSASGQLSDTLVAVMCVYAALYLASLGSVLLEDRFGVGAESLEH